MKTSSSHILKNNWYVAAFSREVGEKLLARKLLGTPVVLYRTSNGVVAALEDRCAHRMLPLSAGYLHEDHLVCGYHGMTFNAEGQCIRVPGESKIPLNACVRTFPVVERDRLIWIWMGEAAAADPVLVPDFGRLNDPGWTAVHFYDLLKADYRLLIDNLLDLSHLTFLHGRTIGTAAVAEAPVEVKQEGEHLSVHRDIVGALAPPFFARQGNFKKPVKRWQTTNYLAPSICVIEVGCNALEPGDGLGMIEGAAHHLATPETEETTHYFFVFVRSHRLDDEPLSEFIRDSVNVTLGEDKMALELQHSVLSPAERDNPVVAAIAADSAPIRGRRILERQLARERMQVGSAASPATNQQ